jgi:hypothetical protein
MVFMMGKSYKYNDYVTLCTWTLDDLGLGNVGKDLRSATFFFLVVLPIFLPVTFTFICLTILIVYFSRNGKNRNRVRVSLADMVEISEGFALTMRNMLDSRQKLLLQHSSTSAIQMQKLPTETLKIREKSHGIVYRTLQKLKFKKNSEISSDCSAQNEAISSPEHDDLHAQGSVQYSYNKDIYGNAVGTGSPGDILISNGADCNGFISQDTNSQIQQQRTMPISTSTSSPVSEFKDVTKIKTEHQLEQKSFSRRFLARFFYNFQKREPVEYSTLRSRSRRQASHAFITLIVIGTTFVLCYSLWCFLFICGFLATINRNWYILSTDGDAIILTMTIAILLINMSSCSTPCIHLSRGNILRNKLKSMAVQGKHRDSSRKVQKY